METFKSWLLSENIEIDPSVKDFALSVTSGFKPVEMANHVKLKAFLTKTLKEMYGKYFNNLLSRYTILLKEIRDGYSEVIFELQFLPLKYKSEEMISPDDEMYDYYMKHKGGKTGKFLFSTPKEALDEIPANDNYVYRGMSYEEWQFIKKNGYVYSSGDYNLGKEQENLTFYSNAATAAYYANSFASVPFKTSVKKPSIVIAIDRNNVKSHEDMPKSIPKSEFAHFGKLPISKILEVWMLVPERASKGTLSIIFTYKKDVTKNDNVFYLGNPREGSRSSPSISYKLIKLKF